MRDIAIRVEHLGKRYRIGGQQAHYKTLRESLTVAAGAPLRWLKGERPPPAHNDFWALDDVSFEIKHGEAVGIIGRNGAGKSTLLKVLSRITKPTRGRVELNGRFSSLLEVGTGFHPELTGRENIFLNGAILGMSRAEISHKFDEIVDFAEVEKFLDTPVKFYSSGMYVRLAFAVAAHLEPDILIVDEVLAVGDAAFQKKCLGKMESVTHQGRTVVFVSHNMAAINSLCNRGILLSNGQIEKDGTAKTVSQYYLSQSIGPKSKVLNHEIDSSLRIQFLKTELIETISDDGVEVVIFRSKYLVRDQVSNTLLLCVETRNSNDVSVFYSNDDQLLNNQKRQIGQHVVELVIPKYLLAPGDYYVSFGFWEPGHPPEHFPETKLSFTRVEPENNRLNKHGIAWPSIIYLPTTWKYISDNNVSNPERNE